MLKLCLAIADISDFLLTKKTHTFCTH